MRAKQEAEQHAQHTAFTEFSKQQAAQQAMFDIPETRVYGNSGERYLRDPPNMVNYDYVDRRHWHDSKKKYTDGRRKNRKFDYLSGTFTPEWKLVYIPQFIRLTFEFFFHLFFVRYSKFDSKLFFLILATWLKFLT